MTDWSHRIKPSFGAIRRVYTPTQGTEITNMQQLKQNGIYVISGQNKLQTRPQGYPPDEAQPMQFMHHINVRRVMHNKGVPKVGRVLSIFLDCF